ncbi:MAG: hypothetical protein E7411_09150 [Ruminococcaceae bacterium]|nr:hypothetical protein [Oscillospiraceae bacterium]
MKKITSMKILSLEMENFRNHTENERFELGDMTFISGHNGTGKTTMAHAICYVLYGVNYYGLQKIERIINEKANSVKVKLEFMDQDGEVHTLIRARKADKGTLLLDGYSVTNEEIEQNFCDKRLFLSMFNPSYLVETLGEKGRELVLKYLAPIAPETVIEKLPSFSAVLNNISFKENSPDLLIQSFRDGIRRAEQQIDVLSGNIQSIKENSATAKQKLDALYADKRSTEAQIQKLELKQFEGIDVEELSFEKDLIMDKLSEGKNAETSERAKLEEKLGAVLNRKYESQFTKPIAEAKAEYDSYVKQYNSLLERCKKVKVGMKCPTCFTEITESNIGSVQGEMKKSLKELLDLANGAAARGREAVELDNKSKATFEQNKKDDAEKLKQQIAELEQGTAKVDASSLRRELEEVGHKITYGNLSEAEVSQLNDLKATLVGIAAEIKTLEEMCDDKKIKDAINQQASFEEQIEQNTIKINAVKEYISKRTELMTASLKMPNVTIRLEEVFRTTGEVKNVFKFDYKGRDYNTLSLSEKTLAGVEIAAMVRKICSIDCPICVDNTESIAAFNNVPMPTQTILLKFIKGQPLTVQSRNNLQVVNGAELKKAS